MNFGTPILGWSGFASPAMLLWGLAAVAPLLIHWWMRRRYRTVAWAATAFLLAAVQRHARRRRLEQWLLLAMRMAILLLAALAWADPAWNRAASRGVDAPVVATHYVLVVDVSYSMAARRDGATALDAARTAALELLRETRQGDGFTLVSLSRPPRLVIGEPTFDRDVVAAELNSLAVQDVGGDLGATWNEVERVLTRAERTHPRLERQQVVVFSDLAANTWRATESSELQSRFRRLAERVELTIFDAGRDGIENLAVSRIDVRDPLLVAGREASVEVEVRSFSAREQSSRRVELFVDGRPAGVRELDLPAAGRAVAAFSPRFEAPGDHVLEARLVGDDVPVDDVRWAVATVRRRVRALCVEGRPGEARYLALALTPDGAARAPIDVETAPETALAERDLGEFDVVWLGNVARLDAAEGAALRRFVTSGGGLAIFAGDLTQPDSYDLHLGPRDGEPSVAPARLTRIVVDAGAGLDPLDYRHPVVAPFRGQPQAGLLTTPVWRYWELEPYERGAATPVFGAIGGPPLALDQRSGLGRCLLIATAPSTEAVDRSSQPPAPWTALPAWPSFVPLVQELLRHLAQGDSAARHVEVGATLEGFWKSREGAAPAVLEMIGPAASGPGAGDAERVSIADESGRTTWSYVTPPRAGPYELRDPQSGETRWYAANVDVEEGDPTRFDAEFLPPGWRKLEAVERGESASSPRGGRQPWFRWLLASVGLLLVLETWAAWRWGSPTSAPGADAARRRTG